MSNRHNEGLDAFLTRVLGRHWFERHAVLVIVSLFAAHTLLRLAGFTGLLSIALSVVMALVGPGVFLRWRVHVALRDMQ